MNWGAGLPVSVYAVALYHRVKEHSQGLIQTFFLGGGIWSKVDVCTVLKLESKGLLSQENNI